jgi:adenylate cyclase
MPRRLRTQGGHGTCKSQRLVEQIIHFRSEHDLPFPRELVWPVLSNTDWFNRALGLPAVQYEFQARAEGGSSTIARARIAGFEIVWQELPFEWLEPEFYRVRRILQRGPFREAIVALELQPQTSGTRAIISSEVLPRNALGKLVAKKILFPKTRHDVHGIMRHVEEFLRGQKHVALPRLTIHPVNEVALRTGLDKLRHLDLASDRIELLERLIRESADVELTHIRPFAIAKKWDSNRWDVLALFLHATECGLLDFRWEILCPNCRSSRNQLVRSLSEISRTSHCDVCQIEFDAEFDKSVELKFAVNQAIRPRQEQTYCLAGPGGKPHVVSQAWLQPGEERPWKLPPLTRPLRLRSPQVKGSRTLDPEEFRELRPAFIRINASGFEIEYGPQPSSDNSVRVHNPNPFPVVLSLDQVGWSEDILTAARVTNWQEFRDLFAHEVISPAEDITVGSQVVLFTDLRGSTAMYRSIGDAPAYALVRDHFAILTEVVRNHHGTVVKTIGDAVMACFSRVDEALEAVRDMNRKLAKGIRAVPLTLKASLHAGPCLAVNANDRLDFFGTTINLAARMVSCCKGGDLVVSDELYHRPEMREFVKQYNAAPEPSDVRLRGFNDPRRIWRVELGLSDGLLGQP